MKPNEKEERCFKNACRGGLWPPAGAYYAPLQALLPQPPSHEEGFFCSFMDKCKKMPIAISLENCYNKFR